MIGGALGIAAGAAAGWASGCFGRGGAFVIGGTFGIEGFGAAFLFRRPTKKSTAAIPIPHTPSAISPFPKNGREHSRKSAATPHRMIVDFFIV